MKERPILFSGEMVNAILRDEKTQTRRIVKNTKHAVYTEIHLSEDGEWADVTGTLCPCPYGKPGDRLWVREQLGYANGQWNYRSDNTSVLIDPKDKSAMLVWAHHKARDHTPSIHMPRWASRITLEIKSVRVERLNEISDHDARAEGIENQEGIFPRVRFAGLWNQINGAGSWDANPWVWVISFTRVLP